MSKKLPQEYMVFCLLFQLSFTQKKAKFVVTMLPESSHVEQVYLDKQNGMKTLSTIATA